MLIGSNGTYFANKIVNISLKKAKQLGSICRMDNYKDGLHNNSEPEGRFADRFRIGYKECVFVLDFLQSFYNDGKERVHTRIITSPEDLKNFLKLIQESIEQYEKIHGPISMEAKNESSKCG